MRTLLVEILLLVGATMVSAQPAAQFTKANQEYTAGDFKTAIGVYEELVRAGEDAPNLFYNLGNAYFRQKDFGRAVLNYERTLALDPRHPEAQANLRIARDESRALELLPDRWQSWLALMNANQCAIAAVVAFWVGVFALAFFLFSRRGAVIVLAILSIAAFALAAFAAYQLDRGKRGLAVVIVENAEARIATADTANRVLTLPAGSEIQIMSRRGDWIYAALPNNLRGWMPANSAEAVRM